MNEIVQNEKRMRGRPRRFEADDALDKATMVFWRKGYDGTTVDDLVAAMGVGRPSLYAIFGDKAAVFKTCLQRYATVNGDRNLAALTGPDDIRDAIGGFLSETVRNATRDPSVSGCLMGSVAAVVDDAEIREFVAGTFVTLIDLVEKRLTEAVAAGQLRPDYPVAQRTRQIVDIGMSYAVRARLGAQRSELLTDAALAADLFCEVAAGSD